MVCNGGSDPPSKSGLFPYIYEKSDALKHHLKSLYLVETMGFEPMIFWSQTRRDNQASLRLETALFCTS